MKNTAKRHCWAWMASWSKTKLSMFPRLPPRCGRSKFWRTIQVLESTPMLMPSPNLSNAMMRLAASLAAICWQDPSKVLNSGMTLSSCTCDVFTPSTTIPPLNLKINEFLPCAPEPFSYGLRRITKNCPTCRQFSRKFRRMLRKKSRRWVQVSRKQWVWCVNKWKNSYERLKNWPPGQLVTSGNVSSATKSSKRASFCRNTWFHATMKSNWK